MIDIHRLRSLGSVMVMVMVMVLIELPKASSLPFIFLVTHGVIDH